MENKESGFYWAKHQYDGGYWTIIYFDNEKKLYPITMFGSDEACDIKEFIEFGDRIPDYPPLI